MKKKISDGKTAKKLDKRLYKMLNKKYNNPDGFYCEITKVALIFLDGEGMYTIDVHYMFTKTDGTVIHKYIDNLIVAGPDGKIEIPFVAGQVYQYVADKSW